MRPERISSRGALCCAVTAMFILGATGAAEAVKPTAEQVAAALANYGSKWMDAHESPGHTLHLNTLTDPGEAYWDGDSYVCKFEGAAIPTTPGESRGYLLVGEFVVTLGPDGRLTVHERETASNIPMDVVELRKKFPDGESGTMSRNWQRLLHLTMTSQERDYSPDAPQGPVKTGSFTVPSRGVLRVQYSSRKHAYAPQGGLGWDYGQGWTRDWPGTGGVMDWGPKVDAGGTSVVTSSGRSVDRMTVNVRLVPCSVPAGFANRQNGRQLADYQEILVEFLPSAPATATPPPPAPTPAPATPAPPAASTGQTFSFQSRSDSQVAPFRLPTAGGQLSLQFRYSTPGTIFDTVGALGAPRGAFSLTHYGELLRWQIMEPNVSSSVRHGTGWHYMDVETDLPPDQWHTIKVTWGPGGMSVWANGQLLASDPAVLTLADVPVHLGDFPGDARALGLIGEIRNVVVTPSGEG